MKRYTHKHFLSKSHKFQSAFKKWFFKKVKINLKHKVNERAPFQNNVPIENDVLH